LGAWLPPDRLAASILIMRAWLRSLVDAVARRMAGGRAVLRRWVAALSVLAPTESTAAARVLNFPLLSGDHRLGPSLRLLWPELVVDPMIRPGRILRPPLRYSSWLAAAGRLTRVIVRGGPGAGKSMLLRKRMLDIELGRSPAGGGVLLLDARDILEDGLPARPEDDVELLLDGLDEVGTRLAGRVVGLVEQWPHPIWIACRTEFLRHNQAAFSLAAAADEVIEVLPWSSDDVNWFIDAYAGRVHDDGLADWLGRIRQASAELEALIANPLHLTLALYLATMRSSVRQDIPRTRYSLYEAFYAHWVRHEADRGTSRPGRERLIQRAHLALSRAIYVERQEGGLSLEDVDEYLVGNGADAGELLADTAFTGILRLEPAGESRRFRGFVHETYGEFLLAAETVRAFDEGGRTLDDALIVAFNDDVHVFVRGALSERSLSQRTRYLVTIESRYRELLSPPGADEPDAIRLREHLLYYAGRLELERCPPLLRDAYERETVPVLRRAAALGAILHGDWGIERDYMLRLSSDSAEQLLNRSVQRVYFGDVPGDLHEVVDDGGPWQRTREAIVSRLADDAERSRRLRWWDLATFRSLLASRTSLDRMTPEEATVVGRVLAEARSAAGERAGHVAREAQALLSEAGPE
jgi:hypothetical protein